MPVEFECPCCGKIISVDVVVNACEVKRKIKRTLTEEQRSEYAERMRKIRVNGAQGKKIEPVKADSFPF